jgi:hypothetical protein
MEDVCTFYGHLVYLTVIWYILWPLGLFYGHLVYSLLHKEKSGNPVCNLSAPAKKLVHFGLFVYLGIIC